MAHCIKRKFPMTIIVTAWEKRKNLNGSIFMVSLSHTKTVRKRNNNAASSTFFSIVSRHKTPLHICRDHTARISYLHKACHFLLITHHHFAAAAVVANPPTSDKVLFVRLFLGHPSKWTKGQTRRTKNLLLIDDNCCGRMITQTFLMILNWRRNHPNFSSLSIMTKSWFLRFDLLTKDFSRLSKTLIG